MFRQSFCLPRFFVAMLCVVIGVRSANGITVGGWNFSRGSDAAILAGGDFAGIRNDLATFFRAST